MKKTIAIIVALMLCVSVLAACNNNEPPPPPRNQNTQEPIRDPAPPLGSAPATLPAGGGTARVSGETEYRFTPNQTGTWELFTYDNDGSDPVLEIRDANGNMLASDDDGGDGLNARIVIDLISGTTYTVIAKEWWGGTESFSLIVSFLGGAPALQGSGGTVRINNQTEIPFTPNQTGTWEFVTSDNGNSDPYLEILDPRGNTMAEDDDSGDGYNAMVRVVLDAGATYTINARFWGFTTEGSYALTATFIGGAATLPSGGGSVRIDGITEYEFTPNQSGAWEFRTTDNGNSDPYLEIFDSRGRLIAEDDDSGDGYNALIRLSLDAGATYTVMARFWSSTSTGTYTLIVTNLGNVNEISGVGGSVRVDGQTEFLFTPSQSGTWEFLTTDNGNSDPLLEIYAPNGNKIAEDDDGGDGYNSMIRIELQAGVTYTVNARFWGSTSSGSYTLYVTNLDSAYEIPSEGGSLRVDGQTEFMFTPNQSGNWEFVTSENGNSDPYLEIYGPNGNLIAEDDDSGDGRNALILVELQAGVTYRVNARFWAGGSGSFTLHVARM